MKRSLSPLLLLAAAPMAEALTINAAYVDGAGQTWDATRRGVINQAIGDWTSLIVDAQTINVTFDFTNAGSSYLAEWNGSNSSIAAAGTNIRPWTTGVTHTVHFNADYFSGTNYTWFDATPTGGGDQPFVAYDALSVARHELGHMLGFIDRFYYNNYATGSQVDPWGSLINGSHIFNSGGLNVLMSGDHTHTDQTLGSLMSPALVNGIRRDIIAADTSMLALAYGYTVIPEPTEYGLMGAGALGLVTAVRRRRKRAA